MSHKVINCIPGFMVRYGELVLTSKADGPCQCPTHAPWMVLNSTPYYLAKVSLDGSSMQITADISSYGTAKSLRDLLQSVDEMSAFVNNRVVDRETLTKLAQKVVDAGEAFR